MLAAKRTNGEQNYRKTLALAQTLSESFWIENGAGKNVREEIIRESRSFDIN